MALHMANVWGFAQQNFRLRVGFGNFDVVGDRGFNWVEEATMIWKTTII